MRVTPFHQWTQHDGFDIRYRLTAYMYVLSIVGLDIVNEYKLTIVYIAA